MADYCRSPTIRIPADRTIRTRLFWNLEGLPQATEGVPNLREGVVTVEGADLSQFVEWSNGAGQAVAVPRRWCVTKDQAIEALDEFLASGEIDVETEKWCQMEFGRVPPPTS